MRGSCTGTAIKRMLSGATPPRTLLLNPSTGLAAPRGWQALVAAHPPVPSGSRYDEVHCMGGGSLLLWLLACAGRAPRGRMVYLHGPVVLPTPESCNAWLLRAGASTLQCDEYDWRRQAVSLGAGGGMLTQSTDEWLKPILRTIAAGRAHELGDRAAAMERRWERNGHLVHRQDRRRPEELLGALLDGDGFPVGDQHGSGATSRLLLCDEASCAVEGQRVREHAI